MKKLLLLLLTLALPVACVPARADRIDTLNGMPDMDYCTVATDTFYQGATSQIDGFRRDIQPATPAILEMAEHGIKLPRDAMYMPDWDKMTEQEKAFIEKHAYTGYDEMAKIPHGTAEIATKMGQTYFEGCMYERTKRKHVNFIETSYDEKEVDARMDKLRVCAGHARVAGIVFNMAQKGMSQNDFWKAFPLHEDFTEAEKDYTLKLVDEAYSWTDTAIALEDKVYFACKAALHLPPLTDDSPYTDK